MLSEKHDVGGANAMVYLFRSNVRRILKEPDDLGTHCLDALIKLLLLDPNGVPIKRMYEWHGQRNRQSETEVEKSIKLLEHYCYASWNKNNNPSCTQATLTKESSAICRAKLKCATSINLRRKQECEICFCRVYPLPVSVRYAGG